MKITPDLRKSFKPGDIFQMGPGQVDSARRVSLVIATAIHSWGIVGYIPNLPGDVRPTWEHIEPTGGRAVYDRDGKRLAPEAPMTKHHP